MYREARPPYLPLSRSYFGGLSSPRRHDDDENRGLQPTEQRASGGDRFEQRR
jgi:hypothetical protein